jgi:hypothetical protein
LLLRRDLLSLLSFCAAALYVSGFFVRAWIATQNVGRPRPIELIYPQSLVFCAYSGAFVVRRDHHDHRLSADLHLKSTRPAQRLACRLWLSPDRWPKTGETS